MNFVNKIRGRFQNFIGFEKLNPLNNFDFHNSFDESNLISNIDLFNFIVQEFSGFFKLGMNCTFTGFSVYFFLCGWGGEICFQMLS
ncbi:hypothetical protein, partial [Methanobrevibacter sp.]|uniref:hypothetical protein n=1 Tax=Methanobrevibacter sp. TaxID=66852 RepID=UPI00386624D1